MSTKFDLEFPTIKLTLNTCSLTLNIQNLFPPPCIEFSQESLIINHNKQILGLNLNVVNRSVNDCIPFLKLGTQNCLCITPLYFTLEIALMLSGILTLCQKLSATMCLYFWYNFIFHCDYFVPHNVLAERN